MSGSESSNPDAAAAPEALSFTVHRVDPPDLTGERRRTARGRATMLLVLLVCAAPVLGSYLMYFVVRPDTRANYGALIQPTRTLPDLTLQALDGRAVRLQSLRGQWLLVVAAPAACAGPCEKLLYAQRQLREMLGRDRDRIDKVWFVTDAGPVAPALAAAMATRPEVTVLRFARDDLARWLQPAAGRALEDHLYLVDPMGEWMMRFPADFEPNRVKRDLERLLRASASWDRPGR